MKPEPGYQQIAENAARRGEPPPATEHSARPVILKRNGGQFLFFRPSRLPVHSRIIPRSVLALEGPAVRNRLRAAFCALFPTRSRRPAILAALIFSGAAVCRAQQPFVTDDADVTARRDWHFEYTNQFAVLQKDSYPTLRQDTSNFVTQYGLFERIEVDLDFPLIAIINARNTGTPSAFGLGDVDLGVKWNLVQETPGSAHPALTVSAAAEFPTGSEKKQLGSGLTDYVFNTVLQKTIAETTALTAGGNYALLRNGMLDFAVFAGWYSAPPRGSSSRPVALTLNS